MQNPFALEYDQEADNSLVKQAIEGSEVALIALIQRHQDFIYNVAHKMVLSPFDAEDVTQEVIIKVITKLSQFEGKSAFRTWLYRITFDHVLQMKRKWLEERYDNFSIYGSELEQIPDQSLSDYEKLEMKELVEEARLGCMAGMLLCLSREQRLIFILGELFKIDHRLGAEMLEISKDNFRQQLSRARKDLYQFMNEKCGLINESNPCRCQKKTKGFIAAGWVDPKVMKFNTSYMKRIYELSGEKDAELCDLMEYKYGELQREHPFQNKQIIERLSKEILSDTRIQRVFDLN